MPNLRQIVSLHQQYGHQHREEIQRLEEYCDRQDLRKAIDDKVLQKAFRNELLVEFINVPGRTPSIVSYFENQFKENVVLLFIDISGFAAKFRLASNALIKQYLEEYYSTVLPIIYQHGGEIEKLIGDGIICVFGKPFLNKGLNECLLHAENCAKQIIFNSIGTDKEVKIALHSGEVMYYKTAPDFYEEYTMLGKALTELWRLESISQNNAINYFDESSYAQTWPHVRLQGQAGGAFNLRQLSSLHSLSDIGFTRLICQQFY